jgi:hypothetical protein
MGRGGRGRGRGGEPTVLFNLRWRMLAPAVTMARARKLKSQELQTRVSGSARGVILIRCGAKMIGWCERFSHTAVLALVRGKTL